MEYITIAAIRATCGISFCYNHNTKRKHSGYGMNRMTPQLKIASVLFRLLDLLPACLCDVITRRQVCKCNLDSVAQYNHHMLLFIITQLSS